MEVSAMKKTLMLVGLLALAATTAQAYVQPGPAPGVNNAPKPYRDTDALRVHDDVMVPQEVTTNADPNGEPSPAVPEPGTMALASMGLLAAGAAMRRRREQQQK
jgi:hypothetical protein